VRELRTALEHAVVLSRGERITSRDLPLAIRNAPALTANSSPKLLAAEGLTVQAAEKELIIRALKETAGNRTLAAKKLGMSRRTLHRKLHDYKLEDL
jgi:two-component system, NtrC family, response regulator AtoC